MKYKISDIIYIRKKERKSLIFLLAILLFSSFSDEIFFRIIQTKPMQTTIDIPKDSAIIDENINPPSPLLDSKIPKVQTAIKKMESEQIKVINKDTLKPEVSLHINPSKAIGVKKISKKEEMVLPFNPNVVNKELLTNAGISEYVASNWVKYSASGAKFYNEDDLRKIYGMKEEMLNQISPLLLFPEKAPKYKKAVLPYIDINTATSEEFAQTPGIGKILSERIVKFRDKLGGFYTVDQLNEVYGIQDSIIEKYNANFNIDSQFKKININVSTEKELSAHPYISYQTAKIIVNYRKQHGAFTTAQELLNIKVIEEDWLKKISNYLEY